MSIIQKIKKSLLGEKPDFKSLIANGAVVIDVRTPQEFQGGHFEKSKNIPLSTINQKINTLKGKEVILVCRSGMRAAQARGILMNQGIKAHNAGAWQNLYR